MDLGFSLASYRANGSLDARFGSDGVVVNLVAGQFATPSSMAVQSSHRVLVVGGTVASAFDPLDVAVARFLV
jgi:hypothetical protein